MISRDIVPLYRKRTSCTLSTLRLAKDGVRGVKSGRLAGSAPDVNGRIMSSICGEFISDRNVMMVGHAGSNPSRVSLRSAVHDVSCISALIT